MVYSLHEASLYKAVLSERRRSLSEIDALAGSCGQDQLARLSLFVVLLKSPNHFIIARQKRDYIKRDYNTK
jgi:hypothetical protein